jgi:hypothetical protein
MSRRMRYVVSLIGSSLARASMSRDRLVELGCPPKFLWPRFQAVVAFMAGLPLSQGRGYVWRLSIDGDTRPDWSAAFCVRAVPAGPVIG